MVNILIQKEIEGDVINQKEKILQVLSNEKHRRNSIWVALQHVHMAYLICTASTKQILKYMLFLQKQDSKCSHSSFRILYSDSLPSEVMLVIFRSLIVVPIDVNGKHILGQNFFQSHPVGIKFSGVASLSQGKLLLKF